MLTKAIILNKLLDNHYLIRVPILESAGDMEISKVEAILSHTPGINESYKEDDVVIVGFEDHSASKPIILGKLFTREDEYRGHAQLESLEVNDYVSLPNNIRFGGIEYKNFSQFLEIVADKSPIILQDFATKNYVATYVSSQDFATKDYVNELVGDIETILTALDVGEGV